MQQAKCHIKYRLNNWSREKFKDKSNLPKEHPYFVNESHTVTIELVCV